MHEGLNKMLRDWLIVGGGIHGTYISNYLIKVKGVDPCGEGGEYHTVVTDGPIFKQAIQLVETEKTSRGEFGRLEIKKFEVVSKQ